MLPRICPCCGRWLQTATVSSAVCLTCFHVYDEAKNLAEAKPLNVCLSQEHAPEPQPTSGRDMPGFYAASALPTTTTTPPPVVRLPAPTGQPDPGNMVAWNNGGNAWVQVPDCGVTQKEIDRGA